MSQLLVDVDAIGRNTEVVAAMLRGLGLGLVAVTKGCLGEPRVAAAMLAGGAVAVADTRDINLQRLRRALPGVELHRIHLPSLAEPFEPGDVTYVSSREGARAVAARDDGSRRRVMIQVETGDEREGVPLDRLVDLAAEIAGEQRLRLEGVATNYACFRGKPAGIRESVESVARAASLLRTAGHSIDRVSGGNSSVLHLIAEGKHLPAEITELRCGEALLLGHDALHYRPLLGCRTDACVLRAEVVEEYTRSSAGGATLRLLLSVGRHDLGSGAVRFERSDFREIGRSADYLVVEAERECTDVPVGTMLDMIPAYEALEAAWASPYVELKLL